MDNVCQLLWEAVLVAGSYCKEVAEMTSIVFTRAGKGKETIQGAGGIRAYSVSAG